MSWTNMCMMNQHDINSKDSKPILGTYVCSYAGTAHTCPRRSRTDRTGWLHGNKWWSISSYILLLTIGYPCNVVVPVYLVKWLVPNSQVAMDDLSAELALAFGADVKEEPQDETNDFPGSPGDDHDDHEDDGNTDGCKASNNNTESGPKSRAGAKKRVMTRRDSLFAHIVWFLYCLIHPAYFQDQIRYCIYSSVAEPRSCFAMLRRHAFAEWSCRRRNERTCKCQNGLLRNGTKALRKGSIWPKSFKMSTGIGWVHAIWGCKDC